MVQAAWQRRSMPHLYHAAWAGTRSHGLGTRSRLASSRKNACGIAAVFFSMLYMGNQSRAYFFAATALTPAALVFDWLDGRVARWRHEHSVLGRELDSLADIIAFGVAPAALGFAAGLRGCLSEG